MKHKAIFLDRDGTINVDTGYLYKWEDFHFIDGVIKTLKKLKEKGFLLIILTNQSGIARGFFTEQDVQVLHNKMNAFLQKNYNFQFDGIYYCPHHEQGTQKKYTIECNCRKPEKGMLLQALKDFDIDLSASIMIGDKDSDNIDPINLPFIKVSKNFTLTDATKSILNR
ncbi:MAG: D-glycero-alpha-D-manno-heptose-1,7-bisphosphate 7-phosphatase [Treponemataceae bacterium]